VLRMLLKAAVEDGRLARSPATGLTFHRAPDALDPATPLTTEHVGAVYATMPAHTREAVLVAAGTGLRRGELLGVRREGPDPTRAARPLTRVDSLRRELRVVEQLST